MTNKSEKVEGVAWTELSQCSRTTQNGINRLPSRFKLAFSALEAEANTGENERRIIHLCDEVCAENLKDFQRKDKIGFGDSHSTHEQSFVQSWGTSEYLDLK